MAKQTFTTGQVLTAAQMTSLQQTAMLGGAASAKVASYVLVAADAGDAITMSNGSATTITVNTGLFAAGDIVTLINLGAGVCTITAGTATVTTSGSLALAQNQGGVLRFTSASAAIFLQFATPASGDIEGVSAGTGISGGGTSGTVTITNSMATEITAKGDLIVGTGNATFDNLGVGANGTILVANSSETTGLEWVAPPDGGMTLLSTTTLSGAATNVTSIASGFNDLVVIIRSFKPASDAGLFMRINNTGSGGNTYYSSTNNAETNASHNASTIQIAPDQDSAGDYSLIRVLIPDYTNTTTWKWAQFSGITQNATTNTNINWRLGVGVWNQTSAINELNFFPGAGTFTSGSVLVYGVK